MKMNMKNGITAALIVMSLVAMAVIAQAADPKVGGLTGKIQTSDGKALTGAKVNLFDVTMGPSPFSSEYWRKYDYLVFTEDDGSFSIQLPEGAYYLMVIKEGPNRIAGPPAEGDFIHPPLDGREPRQYFVKAGETTDTGLITEVVPFKRSWAAKGMTGIQGVVVDKRGRPVEGKLVMASSVPDVEKQVFMADQRTGRDGIFILRVAEGGQYYIRVRGYKQPIVPATVRKGSMTRGIEVILVEAESK